MDGAVSKPKDGLQSVRTKIGDLQPKMPNADHNLPTDGLKATQDKTTKKIDDIRQKQKEGLSEITSFSDDQLGGRLQSEEGPQIDNPIPGLPNITDNLPLDGLNGNGKGAPSPDTERKDTPLTNINNLDTPGLEEMGMPELDMNGEVIPKDLTAPLDKIKVDDQMGEITRNPTDQVMNLDGLEQVKSTVEGAGALKGQVTGFTTEMDAVKEGDLEGLEGKLSGHVGGLDQLSKAKQQDEMMREWRRKQMLKMDQDGTLNDREALLTAAKERGKIAAANHFVGREGQLREAHLNMTALKKKYHSVPDAEHLKGPRTRFERDTLRLMERILWAVDLGIWKT